MEEKLCSAHGDDIIGVCFFEGCNQPFFCVHCPKHPDNHTSQLKNIISLIKNENWIKSCEEQRDLQITMLQTLNQDMTKLIIENQEKLKEMIPEIIQSLKTRLAQWIEELDSIFNFERKGVDSTIEENTRQLEKINFREGDIYAKVEKVKLFNENTLPQSAELSKRAQSILDENKIDQDKMVSFKDEILDSLQNTQLKDLFFTGEFKYIKISEQLALLQKEYIDFKYQLTQENNDYKKKIAILEEENKELQKQVSTHKLDIESLTTFNSKLENQFEDLNKFYSNLGKKSVGPTISLSETSKIINTNDFAKILSWLPTPKNFNKMTMCKLNLLYRASRDGFTPSGFYVKCGSSAPTISFIRSKEHRKVFGGYTTKSWDPNTQDWIEDKDAFLFSLTHSEKYPVKVPKHAIFVSKNHILYFNGDINLSEGCNIRPERACSYFPRKYECSRFASHNDPGAREYLAGSELFLVEEIEVYQVVWMVK